MGPSMTRMRRTLALQILSVFIHLSISSSLPTSGPPAQPIASLGYATYSGVPFFDAVTNTTNTNFLGIRYAAPPTGSLRWAAPQPPRTTMGVQKAAEQPVQCWQASIGAATKTPFRDASTNGTMSVRGMEELKHRATPDASEDCLFLKYFPFFTSREEWTTYQIATLVSVFVPGELGSKKGLPVVFWIHG